MEEGEGTTEYRPTIKDMPVDERPRERLTRAGEGALSTAELLAIILRTGLGGENVLALATRLISKYNGLPGLARRKVTALGGCGLVEPPRILLRGSPHLQKPYIKYKYFTPNLGGVKLDRTRRYSDLQFPRCH